MLTSTLRTELIAVVFGAVFLSLVIQGMTMRPLLSHFGLVGLRSEERAYEEAIGRIWSTRAALNALEASRREGDLSDEAYRVLKGRVEEERERAVAEARRTAREHALIRSRQLARSSERMVRAARAALDDAFRRGLLSESVADELKRELDARLVEGSEAGWEEVWKLGSP